MSWNLSITTGEVIFLGFAIALHAIYFPVAAASLLIFSSGFYLYRNKVKPLILKAGASKLKFPIR